MAELQNEKQREGKPRSTPAIDTPPDILSHSVRSGLVRLAIPALAEQLLLALVGYCDTYFAGTLSAETTAAVGLGSYVGWLVTMIFGLVGTGATALVARNIGAAKQGQANHFFNQAVIQAVLLGGVMAVTMWYLAPLICRAQNLDAEAISIALVYLRIDSITYPAGSVLLAATASLRGAGDMKTPLRIMAVVNLLNVVVTALLVYGLGPFPELGVKGIILGTLIARYVGLALILLQLLKGRSGLRFSLGELRPVARSMRRLLTVGVPAALDGVLLWGGHFVFLMMITRLGNIGEGVPFLAAHYIVVRVESITFLPAAAWSMAAATLVGQGLGAGRPGFAARAGHHAALQCALLSSVLAVAFYFAAPTLFSLLSNDARVHEIGVPTLRLIAFVQPALVMMIIYSGALRGAGDTRTPLAINILGVFIVRLPVAYFFGVVLDGGLVGAWVGTALDLSVRGLLTNWRFSSGRWQGIRV